MTNHDREEGHVTTIPGNVTADQAASVSVPVTVPRSPVPPGSDTPTDGHVPGNGNAEAGHVSVPSAGSKHRFHLPSWKIIGGNGHGNGHEERSPVPVPAVPVPADQVATADVTGDVDKGKKAEETSTDWTLIGMWVVIIVMNAMALLLASSGQIDGTWKWAGLDGDDPRKWLLPGVTELGYLGFLMLGRYALRREQSPFLWWGLAAAAAGAAIFMNSIHGEKGYEFQQGLIFGVASGVSLAMTFAKFLIDYRSQRQKDGHTVGLRPRALTFDAIWYLPLAFRAHLIIRRCERVTKRERALELAEQWRWIYQDTKVNEKKTGWLAARKTAHRTAWIAVYGQIGMAVPKLTGIKVGKVTFEVPPPPPVAPPPVEPPPAAPKRTAASSPNQGAGFSPPPPLPPSTGSTGSPPAPPAPLKVEAVKPVPEAWWTEHKDHIAAVKAGIPTWDTQDKAPTVNDVQKIVANRTNAANTAACIRVLRSQRLAGSN
jgi:hypothetical protein